MVCDKLTIENIIESMKAVLTSKNVTEDSIAAMNRLRIAIGKSIQLADLFQQNTNSTSQLDTVKVTDNTVTVLTNAVNDWLKDNVTENNIGVFDKFINDLQKDGKDNKGYQSVVELLYKKVTTTNEYGKVKSHYELDEHAAKAIGVVGADWLANVLEPELAEHRNDDAIKIMLKLDRKAIVTPEMREIVAGFDAMYTHSANRMGADIYKLLGLKAKKGNSQIEASMKTELGMLAIKAMEQAKILTTDKVSYTLNSEFVEDVHIIKASKENIVDKNGNETGDTTIVVNGRSVKSVHKKLEELHKQVAGDPNKHGVYTNRELAVPKMDEVVNEGITGMLGDVVSVDHKNAVRKSSATGNKLRKAYGIAVGVLSSSGVLQKAMGFVGEDDTIDILKPSVRGRNRQIEETIDYLNAAIEGYGYDTTLFSRWKVITNNRFMIDSNKLNWQDKKLHRFGTTPVEDSEGNEIKVQVTDKNENMFKLALAQAFDLPIDKRTAGIILNGGKVLGKEEKSIGAVMAAITEAAGEITEKGLKDNKITTMDGYLESELFTDQVEKAFKFVISEYNKGEPEHALSGVVELLQYNVAKALGEDYYTEALIETDAITSGYGIKNMQMPVIVHKDGTLNEEATLAELEKVGVFDIDGENTPASYGERVQSGELDSYQDPAKGVADKVKSKGIELDPYILAIVDPKAKTKEDGTFVSLSRAFMKNPFMVLNYGAGITTINTSVVRNAINNLYELVNERYNLERELNSGLTESINTKGRLAIEERIDKLDAQITGVLKAIGTDEKSIKDRLRVSQLKEFKLTLEEVDAITKKIMPAGKDEKQTIGNAIENEFNDKYGHFIKLVKLTNETLTMQFKVAKQILDKKIKKRYEDLSKEYGNSQLVPPISRNEMMVMVQELSNMFPVLDSALKTADGKKAPILIAKQTAVTSEDAEVELLGNVTGTGAIKGKIVTNAALEVYKLVEAYSSGAVVPIHFFDGAVQAKVLSEWTALGVHDANFFTLNDVMNGTKTYNKDWFELNKNYSLIDSLMKAFNGTFGTNTKELRDAIEEVVKDPANNSKDDKGNIITFLDSVIAHGNELQEEVDKVNAGREFIYGKRLRIEHSYFPPVDGESVAYETTPSKLETGKEKLGSGLEEMAASGFTDDMKAVAKQAEKDARPEYNKLPEYDPNSKTMTYAGIGSRETPVGIMELMNKAAKWLEGKGYTLQSGNAIGADRAFEGVDMPYDSRNGVAVKSKQRDKKTKEIMIGKKIDGKWVSVNSKDEIVDKSKLEWVKTDKEGNIVPEKYVRNIRFEHKPNKKSIFLAGSNPAYKDRTEAIAKETHPYGNKLKGYTLQLHARNTHQIFGAKLDAPVDFVLYYVPEGESSGTDQALRLAKGKGIPTINMADKDWRAQLTKIVTEAKTKKQRKGSTKDDGETKVVVVKGLNYKTPDTATAVNTLRRYGSGKYKHYGNPFGTKSYGSKAEIPTQLDDEGVSILYAKWLLGSGSDGYKQWLKDNSLKDIVGNITAKQLESLKKRRQFIVDNIQSGKLDGKELMYFRDTGRLNHAKVLAELVNNKDRYFGHNVSSSKKIKTSVKDGEVTVVSNSSRAAKKLVVISKFNDTIKEDNGTIPVEVEATDMINANNQEEIKKCIEKGH